VTAQVGMKVLNAFNRVQFGAANTSVTSASFGLISRQANAPRQLRFGFWCCDNSRVLRSRESDKMASAYMPSVDHTE
jgi:hypothetical protein